MPLRQVDRWAGVFSDLAFPRHLGSKTNNISDTFDMKNRRLAWGRGLTDSFSELVT